MRMTYRECRQPAESSRVFRPIKNPLFMEGVLLYPEVRIRSLTMTYFHRRMPTIIGAGAFHRPVRDGKGWFHSAMVVRQRGEE